MCVYIYMGGSPCLCVHEKARRRQEVTSSSICCSYESRSLLEPGDGVLATLEVWKPCQCFVQSLPPSLIGKGGECLACFVSARIWTWSSMTVKQLSLTIELLSSPSYPFLKYRLFIWEKTRLSFWVQLISFNTMIPQFIHSFACKQHNFFLFDGWTKLSVWIKFSLSVCLFCW